jgi:alanine-glyoxylate transaminase/serine-glyoxylate transaminase/serine-pyruvate transaminase
MADNELKLMIPGPVQPDDDVLEAMGRPVQPHYGPQWRDLYNETLAMLRCVFHTQGDVFLLVGSGSAALDAGIGSALSNGETIVIGINGFFGERLKSIAEEYGLHVVPVVAEWGRPLEPGDFESAMVRHPEARAVAMVHVETSTTIVNPIVEIGQVARRHGVLFMVDAISSLGGLPMQMDDWGIDLCASASQKCLGAPPGLAPVAVGPRAWECIDRNPAKGHGWYLNLRVWRQFSKDWGDWHPHPVTMATNNVLALRVSLRNLLNEGVEKRLERYRRLALRLRRGLREIGMPPFTPDELMAPVLTAAYGPPNVPTDQIVHYMADVHHIKIAGGLGVLRDRIIRIGHMAPTVCEADIDQVIEALGQFR